MQLRTTWKLPTASRFAELGDGACHPKPSRWIDPHAGGTPFAWGSTPRLRRRRLACSSCCCSQKASSQPWFAGGKFSRPLLTSSTSSEGSDWHAGAERNLHAMLMSYSRSPTQTIRVPLERCPRPNLLRLPGRAEHSQRPGESTDPRPERVHWPRRRGLVGA